MTAETKRNTKPVQVGNYYHDAMDAFFDEKKVPKRFQVEMALLEYFKKEAPKLYEKLKKMEKNNEKES